MFNAMKTYLVTKKVHLKSYQVINHQFDKQNYLRITYKMIWLTSFTNYFRLIMMYIIAYILWAILFSRNILHYKYYSKW